ncbi:MAG: symmetrical bis(5'-nucleosyl)-tetraphosphatase [Neisseriaceae bacterium]
MAHYVIGDVQGCFSILQGLLSAVGFNVGSDTLWFTGDIVNRGPQSLQTLRFIKKHDFCMQTVLGNHDLYLLSLATVPHPSYKKKDTISPILQASDSKLLLDWLRTQPMYLQKENFWVVHAGIFPQWSMEETRSNGDEITVWLRGKHYAQLLSHMYGDQPRQYSQIKEGGFEKLRFAINVFTRMRALGRWDQSLEFKFKSTLADLPPDLLPWFEFENASFLNSMILFGHWSALGLHHSRYTTSLDTGAVWGGALTAYHLETGKTISVSAKNFI